MGPESERAAFGQRPDLLGAGLVFAGGAAGTGLRLLVGVVTAPYLAGALATLAINVVGSAALAGLVVGLRRVPSPAASRWRLLLGTGVLGGFTTYSALALETVELVRSGALGAAAGYALGTVAVGALAALVVLTGGIRRR